MKIVVPIILAIVAALLVYRLGLIQATIAKIAMLAMSGPLGWAKLAAGTAVMAAGLGAFNKKVDDADKSVEKLGTTQRENINTLEEHTAAVGDAAKKQEELARAGQQVKDQFKTGQEKFVDRMAHLDKLVRAGAISWETYSRAVKGAIQDVKKANQRQIQAARPIAAVTMGSTAGFSAVQQANREQERQTQLQRQENRLTEETNRILRGVKRELEEEPEVANI